MPRTVSAVALVAGLVVVALARPAHAGAGELEVVSHVPAPGTRTAPVRGPIVLNFNLVLDPATVTSRNIWAFGRWSGPVTGTLAIAANQRTVTLTPDHPLSAGETVTVYVSHDVAAAGGPTLRAGGYSFQFWTKAMPATMAWQEIDRFSTRTVPNQTSRAYGGIATDLNDDRFLDITIINEDTDDLRVFLSKADGTGLFEDFIQPTFQTGNVPSPSEPSDFNRDGFVDICVANTQGGSVSILLGHGDGTFGFQQVVLVGSGQVRGITVLDVDGDADVDIVATNVSNDRYAILLNDGNGVFGPATPYDSGADQEWPVSAADMNEDGMLDLIIGARNGNDPQMIIRTAVGDGTFSFASMTSGGGDYWMTNCGDLNADGHEDVVVVDGPTGSASVFMGDGTGRLDPPTQISPDPFPLATDLGDLDGDGDLDWLVSSFFGDWRLYLNDGAGNFTFHEEFIAPQAASCALPLDLDNDGDLDLALIDELQDEVILLKNTSVPCVGDVDGDGEVAFPDLLAVLAAWGPCAVCPEDVDQNAVVDFQDLLIVLAGWGEC